MGDNRKAIRIKEIENAHRIQSNMLDDYIGGALDDYNFLLRACVIGIDHVGGALAGPGTDRDDEPPNPKNSVLARVLTRDFGKKTEELTVFWPLFPHDIMPLKPGEHVYVLYEDAAENQHGLWIARIPEPANVASSNMVPGIKKYEEDPDNDEVKNFNKEVCDVPDEPEEIKVPETFVVEDAIPFTARVGDRVIEGSNNTMIVMGRDRVSDGKSGEKEEAGTIDIVVGRADKEDMNMADDKSRVYISMKTDIDANMEIDDQFSEVSPDAGEVLSAVGFKTDNFRVFAKDSVKIVVNGKFGIAINKDGKVLIEAADEVEIKTGAKVAIDISDTAEIKAGGDVTIESGGSVVVKSDAVKVGSDSATEHMILGDAFFIELKTFLNLLKAGPIGDLAGIPVITHPAFIPAIEAFVAKLMPDMTISSKHTTE